MFLIISSSLSSINLLWIKASFISSSVFRISYICVPLTFIHHIWWYLIISNQSGNIEKSPGTKPDSCQSFLFVTVNLNSISAHNFLEISLLIIEHFLLFTILMLYVCQRHNLNILNSSILHDDDNLQIPDYNLYRENHRLNIKRGGDCITTKFLFH